MIPPTQLLALVSDDEAIAKSARELEVAMPAMIHALDGGSVAHVA